MQVVGCMHKAALWLFSYDNVDNDICLGIPGPVLHNCRYLNTVYVTVKQPVWFYRRMHLSLMSWLIISKVNLFVYAGPLCILQETQTEVGNDI